jgi:hypothetical protein
MVTTALTLLFFYWGKPPEISEKLPEISGNLRKTSGKFRRWRKTEMKMYLRGPQAGNSFRSMDSLVLWHPIICSEINVRSFISASYSPQVLESFNLVLDGVQLHPVPDRVCDLIQVRGLLDSKGYGIAFTPGKRVVKLCYWMESDLMQGDHVWRVVRLPDGIQLHPVTDRAQLWHHPGWGSTWLQGLQHRIHSRYWSHSICYWMELHLVSDRARLWPHPGRRPTRPQGLRHHIHPQVLGSFNPALDGVQLHPVSHRAQLWPHPCRGPTRLQGLRHRIHPRYKGHSILYWMESNSIHYQIEQNCDLIQSPNFKLLKGQCHKIFASGFFHESVSPPAPEYPIRTVSNIFKNSRRYSQVKVHHRYQRHPWQMPPVSLTPVANLPPVSLVLLIPVANNGNNIRLLRP